MTLKELLGTKFKDGITFEEAEKALEGMNLADLSKGEYVSKAKYTDDTKLLAQYKAQAEGKQAEIDAAVENAKKEAKKEYDKQLQIERTADKRKRAKEKAYEGLSDEQKSIYDAFIKDDDLTLSDDGESFTNFDELSKPIKEKYKTLFPVDAEGNFDKGGLPPTGGVKPAADDPFGFNFVPKNNNKK